MNSCYGRCLFIAMMVLSYACTHAGLASLPGENPWRMQSRVGYCVDANYTKLCTIADTVGTSFDTLGTDVCSKIDAASNDALSATDVVCDKVDLINARQLAIVQGVNQSRDFYTSRLDEIINTLSASQIDDIIDNISGLSSVSDNLVEVIEKVSSISDGIAENTSSLDVLVTAGRDAIIEAVCSKQEMLQDDVQSATDVVCSKLENIDANIDQVSFDVDATNTNVLSTSDVLCGKVNTIAMQQLAIVQGVSQAREFYTSKLEEILNALSNSQIDNIVDNVTNLNSVTDNLVNVIEQVSSISDGIAANTSSLDVLVSAGRDAIIEAVCSKQEMLENDVWSSADILCSKLDKIDADIVTVDTHVDQLLLDLNVTNNNVLSVGDILCSKAEQIESDIAEVNTAVAVVDGKVSTIGMQQLLIVQGVNQAKALYTSRLDEILNALSNSQIDDIVDNITNLNSATDNLVDVIAQVSSISDGIAANTSSLDVLITAGRDEIIQAVCSKQEMLQDDVRSATDVLGSALELVETDIAGVDGTTRSVGDELCSKLVTLSASVIAVSEFLGSKVDTIANDDVLSAIDTLDTTVTNGHDVLCSKLAILEARTASMLDKLTELMTSGLSTKSELVFNSFDMSSSRGNTPPDTLADVYGLNDLLVWRIDRTFTDEQNPIIVFKIPKNFDSSVNPEVDLHLILQDVSSNNGHLRFRVRCDTESQGGLLGTTFEQSVTTPEILAQGVNGQFKHLRVTVTLNGSLMAPQDWAVLDVRRLDALTSPEFNRNVYLSAVSFRYGVQ